MKKEMETQSVFCNFKCTYPLLLILSPVLNARQFRGSALKVQRNCAE